MQRLRFRSPHGHWRKLIDSADAERGAAAAARCPIELDGGTEHRLTLALVHLRFSIVR